MAHSPAAKNESKDSATLTFKSPQKPGSSSIPSSKTTEPPKSPQTGSNEMQKAKMKGFSEALDLIRLPQPFVYMGKTITTACLSEITGAVEEEYNTPNNRKNYGKFVTALCAACCTSVGDFERPPALDSKSRMEWRSIFLEMPQADRDFIMYSVYMLSEGNKLDLKETICPNPDCKSKGFTVSLEEQEVRFYEHPVEPFSITLEKGYTDPMSKKVFKTIIMNLPTGRTQEASVDMVSVSEVKAEFRMLTACIVALTNATGIDRVNVINEDIVRSLSKGDRKMLLAAIADRLPGFDVIAEMECHCGQKFFSLATVADFFLS